MSKTLSFKDSAYGGVTEQVVGGNPEILTHVMSYCDYFTTVGGDVTETLALDGLLSTDICFCDKYTGTGYPISASCGAGVLTTIWSENPGANSGCDYLIFRAV